MAVCGLLLLVFMAASLVQLSRLMSIAELDMRSVEPQESEKTSKILPLAMLTFDGTGVFPGSTCTFVCLGRITLISCNFEPDPVPLNRFLSTTTGQNVTLYLCTIRNAFQVYLGFAESCDLEVQQQLYLGVYATAESVDPFARSGGIVALMIVATILMFGTATFAVLVVVSGCICSGPSYQGGRSGRHRERKVYDREVPDSENLAKTL